VEVFYLIVLGLVAAVLGIPGSAIGVWHLIPIAPRVRPRGAEVPAPQPPPSAMMAPGGYTGGAVANCGWSGACASVTQNSSPLCTINLGASNGRVA